MMRVMHLFFPSWGFLDLDGREKLRYRDMQILEPEVVFQMSDILKDNKKIYIGEITTYVKKKMLPKDYALSFLERSC
jgi:hypothetical protein